ncbi:mammalian ependymin-related protein 1-like [Lineus longissimus]|uniref:mammalian ependymin-related protein 1-like n=1 Tax=Lineus longissimus TaxID=88925 RepID=UPI002B4D9A39
MKLCLLVLSACLAYATAQIPIRCSAPREWEARLIEFDPAKKFDRRAKVTYDTANQRVRIVEEEYIGGQKEFMDVLYLHNQGIEYRLDIKTRKCEKKPISRPFPTLQIPTNATFYGEFYIGTSSVLGEGVLVEAWGGEHEGARVMGEWTVKDCLPISFVSFGPKIGFFSSRHYDYTLGISDPMVFVPPKECM